MITPPPQYNEAHDSAIFMSSGNMSPTTNQADAATDCIDSPHGSCFSGKTEVSLDHGRLENGQQAYVKYTFDDIEQMWTTLARARRDGLFPMTKAGPNNTGALITDYYCYLELTAARGDAPREDWPDMTEVSELIARITRDIRARDKIAADMSEKDRVNSHVNNIMSGVNAEARLYSIVQHAVTYAAKTGSNEQAATVAGENMISMLKGIRNVINEMSGKGTQYSSGVDIEAILDHIFSVIDAALHDSVTPLDENVKDLGGHVEDIRGEIMHLNAIGQHVNAIDGHVHSLGNNLNAMGTLLNSTNGNVISLNTQLGLLQTIVNMLPRMIAQALEEMVPDAIHTSIGPIMEAIEAQLGVLLPNDTPARSGRAKRSSKFCGFFRKVFRKGGRKHGRCAGAGAAI
ncbi:hypothetical protein AAE478_005968 [Parahypoxylon ruwenzoriense]